MSIFMPIMLGKRIRPPAFFNSSGMSSGGSGFSAVLSAGRRYSMKELKDRFDQLTKEEKLQFMKEIMPEMCQLFGENPEQMMQEMMPLCMSMMKSGNMDMARMMSMMKQ